MFAALLDKMRDKRNLSVSAILAAVFIIFTGAVKIIDVKPIGPADTSVGFAKLNGFFLEHIGTSGLWDKLTDLLAAVAILVALFFAFMGLMEFILTKSLYKVDKEIFALGIVYCVTASLYLFFEMVVVNYRPILEDGNAFPEASFPSSHTVLACVIFATAFFTWEKVLPRLRFFAEKPELIKIAQIASVACLALSVFGRVLAGVHWFTDIFAGVLLSASVVFLYRGLVKEI